MAFSFQGILDWVSRTLGGFLPGIGDAISGGWDGIKDWASGIGKGPLTGIMEFFTVGPLGMAKKMLFGEDDAATEQPSKMDTGLESEAVTRLVKLAGEVTDVDLKEKLENLADIANTQFKSGEIDFTADNVIISANISSIAGRFKDAATQNTLDMNSELQSIFAESTGQTTDHAQQIKQIMSISRALDAHKQEQDTPNTTEQPVNRNALVPD